MDRPFITYPSIHDTPEEHARWRAEKCPFGWHLLDEVQGAALAGQHHLHCDACGLELHVQAVIVPELRAGEDALAEKRSSQWINPPSRSYTHHSLTS